jgi:predicted dienelactone hydrolase
MGCCSQVPERPLHSSGHKAVFLPLLSAVLLLCPGCAHPPVQGLPTAAAAEPQTLQLFDASRGRSIPVALYGATRSRSKPLALISHGYGTKNSAYSFIANALAVRGYLVASVQHEIAGDPEMPTTGEPALVRRPFWERGADNLLYVARALRARGLANGSARLVLIGHSNGGDTSMLFVAQHPELVRAVFTLDNRRMAMPRRSRPRICSVRSSDQPPGAGVVPTQDEQRRHNMLIASVPGLIHDDMWDVATRQQKEAMLSYLFKCLER